MRNGKEQQTFSQRAYRANANNANGLLNCYPGNKFVEKYMYQSSGPTQHSQPMSHVSYGNERQFQPTLRKANEVFGLNTRYSLRARQNNLPKEVLRPEYAVRGTTKLLLNRELMDDELSKTPYLYHVHKPNAFLSRHYRQERDGPNRVAPAPGLGFLSKPHRLENRAHMFNCRRQVKRVGSVPMCLPLAPQRREDGGSNTHYRLLNGGELREQLQAHPAYRNILDPYEITRDDRTTSCLKKKTRLALKKVHRQ